MQDTQWFWDNMYTKQVEPKVRRIAEAAEKYAGESLSSIAHNIDVQWLYCAYEWTRKDGAAGIDGVTAAGYEVGLMGRLENLVEKLKSGEYFAPPVKRVYIPKAGILNRAHRAKVPLLQQ